MIYVHGAFWLACLAASLVAAYLDSWPVAIALAIALGACGYLVRQGHGGGRSAAPYGSGARRAEGGSSDAGGAAAWSGSTGKCSGSMGGDGNGHGHCSDSGADGGGDGGD